MPDRIRVIRIVEYVGPRHWVESTVAKSIHGTRRFDMVAADDWSSVSIEPQRAGAQITAVTLGDFPESISDSPVVHLAAQMEKSWLDEAVHPAAPLEADLPTPATTPFYCQVCGLHTSEVEVVEVYIRGNDTPSHTQRCLPCAENARKALIDSLTGVVRVVTLERKVAQ